MADEPEVDLEEAVRSRLAGVNVKASSYEQGRGEELQWVLDQINPPEEEAPDEEAPDEEEAETEPETDTTDAFS